MSEPIAVIQPDVVDLLIRDHEKIRVMLKETLPNLQEGAELDRASRVAETPMRLEALRREVEAHLFIEEQAFYPQLLKFDDIRSLITRCHEEHRTARTELHEALKLGATFERISKSIAALQADLEKHIQFEESELFPLVRKAMNRTEREALGQQLTDARMEWRKGAGKAA